MFRSVTVFFLLLFLSSCSTAIRDYKDGQPALDLKTFFDGDLRAWGMFQDRSGKVVRRFTIDLNGQWQGNEGVLKEDFVYDDGETQQRIWYLTRLDNGYYKGKADDVVGEASGQTVGYALYWQYTLALPVGDTIYDVVLDDWMYLIDENSILNRSLVTKWGFQVGEVTLFIQKSQP